MAVVYTAELVARAEAFLALATNDKRQPTGLEELAAIWAAMQGRPASSCRQCQFSDYQRDVAAYVREFSRLQNPNTVATSYSLAPAYASETFVHEDYNKVVTADNLTDEDAEFFIKAGRADAFVKNKAAAAVTEDAAPSLDKLTKAELQAKHLEVVGADADDKLTKAELTEAIQAAGTPKA